MVGGRDPRHHSTGLRISRGRVAVDITTGFATGVITGVTVDVIQGFCVPGNRHNAVAWGQIHQPYAHRLAGRSLDLSRARTDDSSRRCDREYLVLRPDHQGTDQVAT